MHHSVDLGYDVIQNQDQILEPPKNQKRSDIYFINKSSNLMDKIYTKTNLDQNDIITSSNDGDGNCFFRVLRKFFYIKQIYHIYYRKVIAIYIHSKKEIDKLNIPYMLFNFIKIY